MDFQVNLPKAYDWSLNLEDDFYIGHRDELISEALQGILATQKGYYVNLVTPGECGEPTEWLIPMLAQGLKERQVVISRMEYVDQCGCGGYVTRVYR